MMVNVDLTTVWAFIIAFAVFAYVVMDGFDLGIGILFPTFEVGPERDRAMNSIAPVWDGNETWLVLGGLLIGKPIGITLFAWLGHKCGLSMPQGMQVRDVLVIGTAAGVGFTVALFVTGVAFRHMPAAKDAASMGALGSFAGMILTVIVARLMKVKKTGG